MKLLLLGTTGYHPNRSRQTACLMLPEQGILLDAGTGIVHAREHLATRDLDIFLTHAHLDHCIGLTYLFDVLTGSEIQRLTIHGEAEKLAAIEEHLFAPLLFPVKLPWEFRPLTAPVALRGGGKLTWFPLEHPGGAIGFRLDWPGHSLAYVTDTVARSGAPYASCLTGVDLLVHECYFSDAGREWAEKTGHSHTTPVAELARQASVGRLVLVHVNPLDESDDPIGIDTARRIFPRSEIGTDGQVIEF